VPEKVTGLTSTSISSTSVSLQWMEVSGDTNVEYVITWEPKHAGGNRTVDDGSSRAIINGLNSNTNYKFQIQARNSGGSGESSDEETFTTS